MTRTGRHRRSPRPGLARRVGVVAVATAGALFGGVAAGQVSFADTAPCGCSQGDDDDDDDPVPSHGDNHGLVVVDNSNADSWLEVDRTLNFLVGGKGTAGSDHDGDGAGDGGDIDVVHAPDDAPPKDPRQEEEDD